MSWKKVRLGDHINVLSGFAFDSKFFNDSKGTPLVRIRDVGQEFSETYYNGDFDNKYLLSDSELLISMDGEFRIAEWKGGNALLNQRVCKISSKNGSIENKFILYLMPLELMKIEHKTPFVTVKHLSVKDISSIEIPLPDLPTQQRIAAILDEADALRKADAQLLTKYDELLQASFLEMFGDIKEMKKKYEVSHLLHVADVVSGVAKNTNGYKDDFIEVPYMRVANVQDGHINLKEIKTIKVSKQDFDKYLLQNNDILLTEGGDPDKLGRGAVWQNTIAPCIHQNHIFRVRTNQNKLNAVYLSRHLSSSYGKKYFLKAAKQTTGIASINMTQLKNFEVIIPPIKLQNHFAAIVAGIEEQKIIATQQQEQSEALFQTLLQRAFKGDL